VHESLGRLDPVKAGHADVHDHNVRAQPECFLDRLHAILGLADYLHINLRVSAAFVRTRSNLSRPAAPRRLSGTNLNGRSPVSISAISGVAANLAATSSTGRPESSEVPGQPDHDGDADDTVARSTAVVSPSSKPGHVNVKA